MSSKKKKHHKSRRPGGKGGKRRRRRPGGLSAGGLMKSLGDAVLPAAIGVGVFGVAAAGAQVTSEVVKMAAEPIGKFAADKPWKEAIVDGVSGVAFDAAGLTLLGIAKGMPAVAAAAPVALVGTVVSASYPIVAPKVLTLKETIVSAVRKALGKDQASPSTTTAEEPPKGGASPGGMTADSVANDLRSRGGSLPGGSLRASTSRPGGFTGANDMFGNTINLRGPLPH